ncbi:hypothetical protein P1J78_21550 [Psychromarinibacter sp. C21-152]|uniref:Uncharacterized protein n=1 Tax=Psychromarinibacter sediminicola TaxID=3033385 RepID=A0AAE3TAJ6_9RHOB|nr:hypothetical protein [Psychromarinibacter sediminicola]MDF0603322.1 hypothetical protein [Psychromarinibacter sediminicola]
MSQEVEHYGLHWDGSVAWLIQGRSGTNFVGLKAKVPFRARGGMCNHLVPAAAPIPDRVHWENWTKISDDPLVRAMMPVPHPSGQNIFFVEDPDDDLRLYLTTLSRMSSPIKRVVKPIWMTEPAELQKELTRTNVQPLALVQATTKEQKVVDTLGQMAEYIPRTVIITGQPGMVIRPPVQKIETNIRDFSLEDLLMLPFENLGALLLRRYSRREDLDAPLESREERRQRMIKERSKK